MGNLLDWFRGRRTPRVAVLVDGPNVLRPEFDVEFEDIDEAVATLGRRQIARLYLDEQAPASLIKAAEAHGFDVRITSGDVDVTLAVEGAELIALETIDVLAIATRDADFKPLMELAGRNGVKTVGLSPGSHGQSAALLASVDETIELADS